MIALSVCGCSTTKKAPIAEVPFSTIEKYMVGSEASVELFIGGAVSRRLKRDRKYQSLHLFVVPGSNIPLRDQRTSYLIISSDSPEGRAVLAILEDEKPWTWQSLTFDGIPVQPFSNHLSLNGQLGTNKWSIDSVYPDPRIARLMTRIRKDLNGLAPN